MDSDITKDKPSESPPVQCNECVINWSSVMDTCGDESIVGAIIEAVMEDSPDSIASIGKAINAQKPYDVVLYAHRLKGEALTIGARRLGEKAALLEYAGEEKKMVAAALLFEQVKQEFETVASFLSTPDWIETAKQSSQTHKSKEEIIQ